MLQNISKDQWATKNKTIRGQSIKTKSLKINQLNKKRQWGINYKHELLAKTCKKKKAGRMKA